jgi:hypothetical protein
MPKASNSQPNHIPKSGYFPRWEQLIGFMLYPGNSSKVGAVPGSEQMHYAILFE